MKFIEEFKAFAVKGNMIDMAVGIIIGGAFGKIVTSLVNDVIMPPLGVLIGGINFSSFKIVIREAVSDAAGITTTPAVTLNYGQFIQNLFDFTIIAFAVFLMIKGMNRLRTKQDPQPTAPPAPPQPSAEEKLLTEIRDILKTKS
ncbi:MAG TPA: large conductance mechanosensitive channel protein MscL [Bacteroidales bacterium]|nr:MAG: large-conductance mechanosensitive channel [Bacteroidetes bacterium GWE2_42_24]OFY25969.1 MAG: large-conductance mechanosensitive channel [Bacteroidetes bacterium GWF2_43_11]PKP23493.1 MAG: large conductance mechanosensitive channel protein MscL [Bacteroidetes bacterium HGW-Bacteroidetes-22]HBZ66622.1 large conductance mechanosensitive channel protein MscL [Bacteroidales bacterium]